MDQCASTLLAFPPQSDAVDNEAYHRAALVHVQRLSKILKEAPADLVGYSVQLFNVRLPSSDLCLPSAVLPC